MKEYNCKECGEIDSENFYESRKSICKKCYNKRNYEASKEKEVLKPAPEVEKPISSEIEGRIKYLEKMSKSFFSFTNDEKDEWYEWREFINEGILHMNKSLTSESNKVKEEMEKLKVENQNLKLENQKLLEKMGKMEKRVENLDSDIETLYNYIHRNKN